MDALLALWSQRAPRERLMIAAALAVVLLAIIYMALIEPASTGIRRLERGLPVMRTQAVQLEQLIAEVASLKARPQVASLSPGEARAALEKSLTAAGLKADKIVPLADGDVQITFANVPYATWSTWLATAERQLGSKAGTVTARATSTPGSADIEMSLRLARR